MAGINQDEYQNTRTILVNLETAQINNEDVVVGACIKLCSQNLLRHWNWRINLESEQLVKLLIEVVFLIPNALFDAICMNKCNSPGINGELVLEIVEELVKLLQDMVVPVLPSPLPTQTHSFCLNPNNVRTVFPDQGDNFPITHPLQLMLDDILELKEYLEEEDINNNLMPHAHLLLPMCNDIRTMCNIYSHFVSLVWKRTNSNGNFNHTQNELARHRTYTLIRNDPQCMLTEFLNKYEAEFGPVS